MIDINKISTEKRNKKTKNIDLASTGEILKLLNDEDKTVAFAVEKAIPQITRVVDLVAETFQSGGRLIYIGAGTSGRLGVLDASECPPTFGVREDMVIGVIAGGEMALRHAVEEAEDSKEQAHVDLKALDLTAQDMVIGIAASGVTPYPIGGIEYANSLGCRTACITTNDDSEIARIAQYPIEAITGAEPLTGSTRMKSGTAQKLILNMISTAAMVKIGKVYENLMIDVQITNNKLTSRAQSIVSAVTGAEDDVVKKALKTYKNVKCAIFSILTGIDDEKTIRGILEKHNGNIRESLRNIP